jgi:hypothetical protein
MKINPNQIIGYKRNNRRSNYNVGDKIIVKLDGKEYSTEITEKIQNGRYSIIDTRYGGAKGYTPTITIFPDKIVKKINPLFLY